MDTIINDNAAAAAARLELIKSLSLIANEAEVAVLTADPFDIGTDGAVSLKNRQTAYLLANKRISWLENEGATSDEAEREKAFAVIDMLGGFILMSEAALTAIQKGDMTDLDSIMLGLTLVEAGLLEIAWSFDQAEDGSLNCTVGLVPVTGLPDGVLEAVLGFDIANGPTDSDENN